MKAAALALLSCGACGGVSGTISLELVTAEGSTVLDDVVLARLTLSRPLTVVEAPVGTDGRFELDLDVPADGNAADLTFEGLDAVGRRIAYGRTPPLGLSAIDGTVAIYVAAPGTMAAAPVVIEPPRLAIGTAAYPFGVLVAGGVDGDGDTSDALAIYNAYTHALVEGAPLPAPRAALAAGFSANGYAYFFGGRDDADRPTGTLWRFDPAVAGERIGEHAVLDDDPALARAGVVMARVASEGFLVTGDPPVVIDGLNRTAVVATTVPPLAGTATTVAGAAGDDALYTVIVGEGTGTSGAVQVSPGGILQPATVPDSARRTGHGAAPNLDGHVVVVGGAVGGVPVASAIDVAPATATYVEHPGVLETSRVDAAVAVGGRFLVVAGGTDASGAIVGTAEILDASTLQHLATLPMVVPRTGAAARPLANGQVLVVGGADAAGASIATIELFTPDPDLRPPPP